MGEKLLMKGNDAMAEGAVRAGMVVAAETAAKPRIDKLGDGHAAAGPGGALEAVLDARAEGLTRFIGITGHGVEAPAIFLDALRRFDFDSVLFPLNFVQYANPVYRRNAEELLRQCRQRKQSHNQQNHHCQRSERGYCP